MILELPRLATGPLEHLVEINSLNAHLCECDRRPWFHGLCNDGFKLSVFLVGFQLLALIDTLFDIALCVCSIRDGLWLYHYACGRVAHLTLLTVQNKVHM